MITQGKVHFSEPDLDMLVRAAVMTGKLRAVVTPEPAEAFIIAVPTPLTEDKRPDLSFIDARRRRCPVPSRQPDRAGIHIAGRRLGLSFQLHQLAPT